MGNKRSFYRCEICGNLVGKIEDSGVNLVCCGQEMTLLEPNSTDGTTEKHVPVIEKDGNIVKIKIGSDPHPMTKEHHIGWIVLSTKSTTIRKSLEPGDAPEASLPLLEDGKITVYAWCNLHGLWKAEQ